VAVGLPQDALARQFVCIAATLAPNLRAARAFGDFQYHDRLCQLILCPALMQRMPFFEDHLGNQHIGWTDHRFEREISTRMTRGEDIAAGTPIGGRDGDLLGWRPACWTATPSTSPATRTVCRYRRVRYLRDRPQPVARALRLAEQQRPQAVRREW
jgi:hypothetical protein